MKIQFPLIRVFLFSAVIILNGHAIRAQNKYSDSLVRVVANPADSIIKADALYKLSYYYSWLVPDSATYYADSLISFSKKIKYNYGEAIGYLAKGNSFDRVGDYPLAHEMAYKALDLAKNIDFKRDSLTAIVYLFLAHLNFTNGNNENAKMFDHQAVSLLRDRDALNPLLAIYLSLAFIMINTDQPDSSLFYVKKSEPYLPGLIDYLREPTFYLVVGNIYRALGKNNSAEKYYRQGLEICNEYNTIFLKCPFYTSLAGVLSDRHQMDSAIYCLHQSLSIARKYKFMLFVIEASDFLAVIYDGKVDSTIKNTDSTLRYLKLMNYARDVTFDASKLRQFQLVTFEDEKREKALSDEKTRYQEKIKVYVLLGTLLVFLLLAFVFWRNNRQRKKTNVLLTEEKLKVENTLSELKSTQSQLIQSEKMASLGQLTAGIAHEIQNPLNFVNNFSELDADLIVELKEAMKQGQIQEAEEIADNIANNAQKINHHGKKAAAIVKGMLQHSRNTTMTMETTDINALVDEAVRLSYYGIRANDAHFHVTINTEYDNSLDQINLASQEIIRVFVNLMNNAFYAISEKKKQMVVGYSPTITVSTKKLNKKVQIIVKDNGTGIPKEILDKIFQPFFTTKPTGQGTGLGLSLSYDIIKTHNGEFRVETNEDNGASFIILLPLL